MRNKHWFFILLLSLAALSLAGTAAYFSVFGLTKLFYAAGIGITILAASLEFAKLVTVSYVYRFWTSIKRGIRGFYVFAVIFIMFLTSIGVYGFLTGAYQQTANKIELRDSQIAILENKKTMYLNSLDRLNNNIKSADSRINTLSGLRTQQETRLDTLYNRQQTSSARRTETQISSSDEQIKELNSEITDKMKQISVINDSILVIEQKIIEWKSSDVSNEVGPYKFISDLTGLPMNSVVNMVALFIILVFDPLAIGLLIAVNQLTMSQEEVEKRKINSFLTRFRDRFKRKKNESEPEQNQNPSELDLKKKLEQSDLNPEVADNQIQKFEVKNIDIELNRVNKTEKQEVKTENSVELKEEVKDELVDLSYYPKPQPKKDEYDEFEPKHIAHINSAHYIPNENNL